MEVTEQDKLWYKLLALVLFKYDLGRVRISEKDLRKFRNKFKDDGVVVVKRNQHGIFVELMSSERAKQLEAKDNEQRKSPTGAGDDGSAGSSDGADGISAQNIGHDAIGGYGQETGQHGQQTSPLPEEGPSSQAETVAQAPTSSPQDHKEG